MNPLDWKPSIWIIGMGSLIGAAVAIVTGVPVLAESIPYATKAYVEMQLQFQQQTRSYDRRDELDFQITQEKSQLYTLQLQLSQDSDTATLIDKFKADIERKQREYDLLDCQLKYAITHITCTQSP